MTYNLYIKTHSLTYNILNIEITDLEIVIEAFNKGKEDFFIAGKKYWLKNLFEIKIFEFYHPEKFDKFVELATEKGLFQISFLGKEPYLPPQILKEGGKEITRDYIKGEFGFLSENNNRNSNNVDIDIFISHSSSDIIIVKSLIEIIRKSFNLPSNKIRCSSVPGYKFQAGVNTDEQIKKEIYSSKSFIGVLTEQSITSTYVLFELGARWILDLPMIPLICDRRGADLLNGPIKNINTLSANDSSDLLQFLFDLGNSIGIKPESPEIYIDDIHSFQTLINEYELNKTYIDNKIDDEYFESDDLIKKQSEIEWSEDHSMQLHYIEEQKEAVKQLKMNKPKDLTIEEFTRIRERAKDEWPLNYVMQLHFEKDQIESLRKLKKI